MSPLFEPWCAVMGGLFKVGANAPIGNVYGRRFLFEGILFVPLLLPCLLLFVDENLNMLV